MSKKVFNKCKACHVVNKTKNKVGPHLKGIIGRQAASVEGYKYSKAMKASGLVWDDATLAAYLKKPRKFVKGTKMAFAVCERTRSPTSLRIEGGHPVTRFP